MSFCQQFLGLLVVAFERFFRLILVFHIQTGLQGAYFRRGICGAAQQKTQREQREEVGYFHFLIRA
jgi:hypothetical protein